MSVGDFNDCKIGKDMQFLEQGVWSPRQSNYLKSYLIEPKKNIQYSLPPNDNISMKVNILLAIDFLFVWLLYVCHFTVLLLFSIH